MKRNGLISSVLAIILSVSISILPLTTYAGTTPAKSKAQDVNTLISNGYLEYKDAYIYKYSNKVPLYYIQYDIKKPFVIGSNQYNSGISIFVDFGGKSKPAANIKGKIVTDGNIIRLLEISKFANQPLVQNIPKRQATLKLYRESGEEAVNGFNLAMKFKDILGGTIAGLITKKAPVRDIIKTVAKDTLKEMVTQKLEPEEILKTICYMLMKIHYNIADTKASEALDLSNKGLKDIYTAEKYINAIEELQFNNTAGRVLFNDMFQIDAKYLDASTFGVYLLVGRDVINKTVEDLIGKSLFNNNIKSLTEGDATKLQSLGKIINENSLYLDDLNKLNEIVENITSVFDDLDALDNYNKTLEKYTNEGFFLKSIEKNAVISTKIHNQLVSDLNSGKSISKAFLDKPGNEAGNISSDGYSALYKNVIYYRGKDGYLEYVNTDTLARGIITNDLVSSINVYANNIFYCNESDGGSLYKIGIDGSNRKKLTSNYANYINVLNDFIYYTNDQGIFRLNLDGTNQKKISSSIAYCLNVVGDWAYYINMSDAKKITKLNLTSLKSEKLINPKTKSAIIAYKIIVTDTLLYYLSLDQTKNNMPLGVYNSNFGVITLDGRSSSILFSGGINNFNVNKDMLSYSLTMENGYDALVLKSLKDGISEVIVFPGIINIQLLGDGIFVTSILQEDFYNTESNQFNYTYYKYNKSSPRGWFEEKSSSLKYSIPYVK